MGKVSRPTVRSGSAQYVSVKKRKYDYVAETNRGELHSVSKKKYDELSREFEAKYKSQAKMGSGKKNAVPRYTTKK